MLLKRFIFAIACAGGVMLVSAGRGEELPTTRPAAETGATTQPTTRPALFSVSGHVSISTGLDFQKPDLSRVVIYVASDPTLDALPLTLGRPEVAQRNKSFVPNFLAITRGAEVEFPNWDRFEHNVFSRSKAAPAFDLERYPYGQSKTRMFDKVGVVQVFCNIHPSMRAIIFVAPNPFFTRADAQGQFELGGLPAGKYELVAWQERCEEERKTVDLGADSAASIDFTLGESRKNILANDPPRRGGGYGVERGLGVKREPLNLPVVKDSHPAPPESDKP